jgi:hypothetical protein
MSRLRETAVESVQNRRGSSPPWPGGRRFAFTIFDDTDWATVTNVKPVYDLLTDLNIRTTKSVWVYRGDGSSVNPGESLADDHYLDFIKSLRTKGFEIGLHNVSSATSTREQILSGLDRMSDLLGQGPLIHCNHSGCADDIYWGESRLTGWRRRLYRTLTQTAASAPSRGHLLKDPCFWGDLCKARIRYVRSFVFEELNAFRVSPLMPYHDPRKPFVNFWFCSSDGGSLPRFIRNFTKPRIERLMEDGGLCIAYVHFAGGFAGDGRPELRFRRIMEYIASQSGWFAPVSTVLDHLRQGANPEQRVISPDALRRLETRWLFGRIRDGARKIAHRQLGLRSRRL